MSTSTSRLSYSDCFDLMDAVLADPKGKRVKVILEGKGKHLRVRLYTARNIDRKDNKDLYEPDHPLYGRSVYDPISVSVRCDHYGMWWVYLERSDQVVYEAESLADKAVDKMMDVVPYAKPPTEVPLSPAPVEPPKTPIMEVIQRMRRTTL